MHVEHVRWSGIFRALAESEQFTQAFSRIFRDTQGYWCVFSHTHRRTTRKGEGGDWFATIWKSKKSPDFWGESPEDLGEKTQKCSLERLFFNCVSPKCLSKWPTSTKLPLLWKISGCALAFRHYSFCKTLHLKCLTVLWISLPR